MVGQDPMSVISVGALQSVRNGQDVTGMVLQCLQVKLLAATNSNVERYRTVFSDTKNFIQTMLGTSLNELVTSQALKKGDFARITQYNTSEVRGKKILVALGVEVLPELGNCEKLGEPQPLEGVSEGDAPVKEEQKEQKPNAAQPNSISSNGFYGNNNNQQQQQQQQRALPTRTNNSSSYGNIHAIEGLSPYTHKWTIKARVTHKSDIKTWHNKNGEGKLFSVTFMDESGEIRATAFNDQVDRLHDMLQDGSVYYISSPCSVKLAKKQFSNVNNDYELTFERDTQIEKCEDQESVPQIKYNFCSLGDLQSLENNAIVDVIGVLSSVGEVSQITSKQTSKPYDKRELSLVDNTNYSVRLTIWGNTATHFDAQPETVVAFKGVKVSDFGGRSLSLLSSGSMTLNPDIDLAHKLKGWYDAQGRSENFETHAAVMGTTGAATGRKEVLKTVQQVRDENLGMSESTDYFTVKATVVYIKGDNISYPACQSDGCNKKVVENNPGEWRCERCDTSFEAPQHRYILQANVSDHTGQLWLSCFDEVGRLLIGLSADDLHRLREDNDKAASERLAEAACQQWVFRCRAKMDTYQDQQRVRYSVTSASPINYAQEANRLAALIKEYNISEDSNSLFVH